MTEDTASTPANASAHAPRPTGWFKAMRFPQWPELVRENRAAFVVAFAVGYRARWNKDAPNIGDLRLGEAFVDYAAWGLSRQEFRTAVKLLKRHGLLTSRLTSRGTAFRLIGTHLFEALPSEPNQLINQPTNQPANHGSNHKLRTKIKERKNKKEVGHAPAIAGDALSFLSDLPVEEKRIVNLYHAFCPQEDGFLRVTKMTTDLKSALYTFASHTDAELTEIFQAARSQPRTNSNRTVVRILWNYYEGRE